MHIPLNCAGDQGHCSLPPWSLLIASTTTEKTSLFFVELGLQNKRKQLWGQRKKLANVNYKHGVISHLRLKKAVNTTDEKQASYCVSYFTFPPDRILVNLHRRPSMICTSCEIQSETHK